MDSESQNVRPENPTLRENVGQCTARKLAKCLAQPDMPLLVDVREPVEWQWCHIAGAIHLPMGQLAQRLNELDRERDVVVYCHHGIRSQAAAVFLSQQGFNRVHNLVGGIDAWSKDVDPSIPRY